MSIVGQSIDTSESLESSYVTIPTNPPSISSTSSSSEVNYGLRVDQPHGTIPTRPEVVPTRPEVVIQLSPEVPTVPTRKVIIPTLVTQLPPTRVIPHVSFKIPVSATPVTPKGYAIPQFLLPYIATLVPTHSSHFVWSMVDHMLDQNLIHNDLVQGLPSYLFHRKIIQAFEDYLENVTEGSHSVPLIYKAIQDNYLNRLMEKRDEHTNGKRGLLHTSSIDECSADVSIKPQLRDESCQNFADDLHGCTLFLRPHETLPERDMFIYTGLKTTIINSSTLDALLEGPNGHYLLELTRGGNDYLEGNDAFLKYANMNIIDPTKNVLDFVPNVSCGLVIVKSTLHGGNYGKVVTLKYADSMYSFPFYVEFYLKQLLILSNVMVPKYHSLETYFQRHKCNPLYEPMSLQLLGATITDEIEAVLEGSSQYQRSYVEGIQQLISLTDPSTLDKYRIMFHAILSGEFMSTLREVYPQVFSNIQSRKTMFLTTMPPDQILWYLIGIQKFKEYAFTAVHEVVYDIYEHPFTTDINSTIVFEMMTDLQGDGSLHLDPHRRAESIKHYRTESLGSSSMSRTNPSVTSSLPFTKSSIFSFNQVVKKVPSVVPTSPSRNIVKVADSPPRVFFQADHDEGYYAKESVMTPESPPSDPPAIDNSNPNKVFNAHPFSSPPSMPVRSSLKSSNPIPPLSFLGSIKSSHTDDHLPSSVAEFVDWDGNMGFIPTTGPLCRSDILSPASNPYLNVSRVLGPRLPAVSQQNIQAIIRSLKNASDYRYLTGETSNPFYESSTKKVDKYIPDNGDIGEFLGW